MFGTTVIMHMGRAFPGGDTQMVEITDICLGNKIQLLRRGQCSLV